MIDRPSWYLSLVLTAEAALPKRVGSFSDLTSRSWSSFAYTDVVTWDDQPREKNTFIH